jgi:hypothetical protein
MNGRPVHAKVTVLLAAVYSARAAHAQTRGHGASAWHEQDARRELLAALEEYATELARHRWPVPPGIRDELRLNRALCALHGRRD